MFLRRDIDFDHIVPIAKFLLRIFSLQCRSALYLLLMGNVVDHVPFFKVALRVSFARYITIPNVSDNTLIDIFLWPSVELQV